MEPETYVAITVAVVVPVLTFRFALRQDRERWLRDRRTDLYVDLLTEAHAERQYLEDEILLDPGEHDEDGGGARHLVDLRLPAFDRARLGARGTAYGSHTI